MADAFGLAVFTFIGAQTAYAAGAPASTVIHMGTLTGVAGGVMRDVPCAEVPLILRREVYATASVVGGIAYVALQGPDASEPVSAINPVLNVFVLRLTATGFDLDFPTLEPGDGDRP